MASNCGASVAARVNRRAQQLGGGIHAYCGRLHGDRVVHAVVRVDPVIGRDAGCSKTAKSGGCWRRRIGSGPAGRRACGPRGRAIPARPPPGGYARPPAPGMRLPCASPCGAPARSWPCHWSAAPPPERRSAPAGRSSESGRRYRPAGRRTSARETRAAGAVRRLRTYWPRRRVLARPQRHQDLAVESADRHGVAEGQVEAANTAARYCRKCPTSSAGGMIRRMVFSTWAK